LRRDVEPEKLNHTTFEWSFNKLEHPAYEYVKQLFSHKMGRTGFDFADDFLNNLFDKLTRKATIDSKVETQVYTFHYDTFGCSYYMLYSTLYKMYSQFRMKLNYRYSSAERSYWFIKSTLPFVVNHLASKIKYQVNEYNVMAMALCIMQLFLYQTGHVQSIIDPINTINEDDFNLINDALFSLVSGGRDVLGVNLEAPMFNYYSTKILTYYFVVKYHFQLPLSVTYSGEALSSCLQIL